MCGFSMGTLLYSSSLKDLCFMAARFGELNWLVRSGTEIVVLRRNPDRAPVFTALVPGMKMRNIFQPLRCDQLQAGCNYLQIRRFAGRPFGNSPAQEQVRLSPVERLTNLA